PLPVLPVLPVVPVPLPPVVDPVVPIEPLPLLPVLPVAVPALPLPVPLSPLPVVVPWATRTGRAVGVAGAGAPLNDKARIVIVIMGLLLCFLPSGATCGHRTGWPMRGDPK